MELLGLIVDISVFTPSKVLYRHHGKRNLFFRDEVILYISDFTLQCYPKEQIVLLIASSPLPFSAKWVVRNRPRLCCFRSLGFGNCW